MDNNKFDVVVVGGGAAGMAAAITCLRREPHNRLVLVEGNDVCGKKLLATGNGRCNISNLSADDHLRVKEFFKSIGVLFRIEDGGRVYPMSGQAVSVRDALVCALERTGAEIRCGIRVLRLEKESDDFTLWFDNGSRISASRLLIATGGKAGPQYGCRGDGFAFARSFGHSIESIRPALVPLVYKEREKERLSGLKGVRIRAQAELCISGRRAAASSGELQFTDYGLSGVMIFDISTMMPKSVIEGKPSVEILLDFAPGEEEGTLEYLIRENEGFWLEGVLGRKLSELLVEETGGDAARIAGLAKKFAIQIDGTRGWREAQATLGGVRTTEVNEATGESLLCKGLFFAGEVLEPVYICGGYNLNHAWATGLRAGENL